MHVAPDQTRNASDRARNTLSMGSRSHISPGPSDLLRVILARVILAWGISIACGWQVSVFSQTPTVPPQPTSPNSEQTASKPADPDILRWIQELDGEDFETREFAAEELFKNNDRSVAAIASHLPGSSLEATIRSIAILTRIATTDVPGANDAQLAILQLAELTPAVAGRYAKSSLRPISRAARGPSIRRLQKSGATPIYRVDDDPSTPLTGFRFDDQWHGEESDFQILQFIEGLSRMELVGKNVAPYWFEYLAKLPSIGELEVKDATLTREAIDQLSRIESLRTLELRFVVVGDDLVDSLGMLKQLQYLLLVGTKITSKGKGELQNSLAGTEVDHRTGGFLGVRQGSAHPIGCLIDKVVEGRATSSSSTTANGLTPSRTYAMRSLAIRQVRRSKCVCYEANNWLPLTVMHPVMYQVLYLKSTNSGFE
jgi:hypothetical protein